MSYLAFFPVRRQICYFHIATTKSLFIYMTHKTTINWHSVDRHFQNQARSMSFSLLPVTAACTASMNICNQSPLRLTMKYGQKSLMLHWHIFSKYGRESVAFSFAYKCGLYVIYECLHPIAIQITPAARPQIFDTLLTLIFRMRQGAYFSRFWLWRRPIHPPKTMTYQSQCFAICRRISECDSK